jgi:hypothetical protein
MKINFINFYKIEITSILKLLQILIFKLQRNLLLGAAEKNPGRFLMYCLTRIAWRMRYAQEETRMSL